MRFDKVHKFEKRLVSPRRLAAAKRALQRERDALPLFAEQISKEQPSPAGRIARMDQINDSISQSMRDYDARKWREARRIIYSLPIHTRHDLLAMWNKKTCPGTAVYFADFLTNKNLSAST